MKNKKQYPQNLHIMQQKIAQLVDMLKKQGIPDDMIRMFSGTRRGLEAGAGGAGT